MCQDRVMSHNAYVCDVFYWQLLNDGEYGTTMRRDHQKWKSLCACVCEIFLLMTLLYINVNMIDYDLLII